MSHSHSQRPTFNRGSAPKRVAKPVHFVCLAPEAATVAITGDFNHWSPAGTPMKRQIDGSWHLDLTLSHGHHRYMFLVDGQRTLDPKASGVGRDDQNERVSLVAVS
jgi:1,4-alpha-glucan branching enzyme